ncbi:MAG: lysophospholipid acyltransferase family protein [bacterium]
MTLQAFQQQLRATGCYETPAGVRSAAAERTGFLRSVRFHLGVADRAVSGGCKAWVGRYNYEVWAQDSLTILQSVERLGGSVVCEGFAPRAACAGPVVYVANHMSMLETMLLPCVLTPFSPVIIVLKDSLLHYPFFGALCRSIAPIVVSRTNVRADLQAVLAQGCDRLAAGKSVLLFPQGTRMAVFDPRRFNSMGAKLAQAARVPLVPVALRTDFVGLGRWIKDLGPIDPSRTVRFAAGPVLAPDMPAKILHQQCLAFITGRFREWGVPMQELEPVSQNV